MRGLRKTLAVAVAAVCLAPSPPAGATDHNDPDKINSIFPDIEPSAADIYGLMAWPEDPETIAVVLTWADVDYDRDLLYQIHFDADPGETDTGGFFSGGVFSLFDELAGLVVDEERTINVRFGRRRTPSEGEPAVAVEIAFADFEMERDTFHFPVETEVAIPVDDTGEQIFAFVGRRDDPFFIDLIGFFDSIWFGHPPGPESTWGVEDKSRVKGLFARDAAGSLVTNEQGRPQFVYDSDNDEQAGLDVHALVLRIPRHLVADDDHPIIGVWSRTRRVEG
ncbi:MAG TPA: DUF4331 family protein [Nannocystaceae bacterium]|nr:DUF4331 family protein [Nannocystaceae bacterium]